MSKTLPQEVYIFRSGEPLENKSMPYFPAVKRAIEDSGVFSLSGYRQTDAGYAITAETRHQWSQQQVPDSLQKNVKSLGLPETAIYDLRIEVEYNKDHSFSSALYLVGLDPAESTYEETEVKTLDSGVMGFKENAYAVVKSQIDTFVNNNALLTLAALAAYYLLKPPPLPTRT